jgi:hypothetical protein
MAPRVAPSKVDELLEQYNVLVPERGEFRGSLLLDSSDPSDIQRWLSTGSFSRLALRLSLAGSRFGAVSLETEADRLDSVTYLVFKHADVVDHDGDSSDVSWRENGKAQQRPLPMTLENILLSELKGNQRQEGLGRTPGTREAGRRLRTPLLDAYGQL